MDIFTNFHGNVVYGNGIGKTINTPTANIKVNDDDKIIPADGVYAVFVKLKIIFIKEL